MTENGSHSTEIKDDEKKDIQQKTESVKMIAFGRTVGVLELKSEHERRRYFLDEGVRIVLTSSSSTTIDETPNQKKIHKYCNSAQQKREKSFQAKGNKNFKR